MRHTFSLLFALGLLFFLSLGCAHMSDPCDNQLIKRAPSPDGSVVLSTYHRECSSAMYTTAAVEKPPGFFGTRGEVVCYLMTWRDRHPVEAVWIDGQNILVSTTDRLEASDLGTPHEFCGGILFHYKIPRRNERQWTLDSSMIDALSAALQEMGPCVNAYYRVANPHNDPFGDLERTFRNGEHRSAVELMIEYSRDAGCAISQKTYETLVKACGLFDLKQRYRDDLEALPRKQPGSKTDTYL